MKATWASISAWSLRWQVKGLVLLLFGACSNERPDFGPTEPPTQPSGRDASAATAPSQTANQPEDAAPAPGPEPGDHCPNGCNIDGSCFPDGDGNPSNLCQVCDAAQSTSGWSSDDGKPCSDDSYCTVDDFCSAGECVGDPRVCDDGVACNGQETCDDATRRCVGTTSTCSLGEFCDVERDTCSLDCPGCVIEGNCYSAGTVSAANECLVCDLVQASDVWSAREGASCDDGDLCTLGDECDGSGQCGGTAVVCVDDSEPCGADRSCDPNTGMCVAQYPGNGVTCSDGDACTGNDRCNGAGECSGMPAADSASGCDCISNSDCDDGVACTTDSCNQGQCTSVVSLGNCRIGGQCYSNGTPNPTNPCQLCDAGLTNGAWSDSPSNVSCDDGLWCNGDNDTCDGQGSCSHAYPSGNRCAASAGACELQTCSESKKNCYKPAGDVCDEQPTSGCVMGNSCSSDVYDWPVQYTCSGSSPNCGTVGTPREDLATLKTNCGTDEACHTPTGTCRPALGCSATYCRSGLCWTKANATTQYTQDPARGYCGGLELAGRTDWRLPTVAEMETLLEGPTNGCYWPAAMGDCNDELWTTDNATSFAFWVGTAALQMTSTLLHVRCVVTE